MTHVHLLTGDKQLIAVCRGVVSAYLTQSIELTVASSSELEPPNGLLFFDLSSSKSHNWQLGDYNPAFTVLFVDRQELLMHAGALMETRCRVIIKPVSAARIEMIMRQCLEQTPARSSTRQSENDALLQSILESNIRLQAYDQDRNNFLVRALHDFRTPLTALEGYSGLLLDKQFGEVSQAQAIVLERMQQSIRRLTYLSEGMFQIVLGQNALPPLKAKPDNIGKCIDQVVHEMSETFADKGLELILDISSPLHALIFERSQIERVLVNLLENAVKFSPRSSSITLRAYPYSWDRGPKNTPVADGEAERRQGSRSGTDSFRIDIEDSGPGLREESLPYIFEDYRNIQSTDDRCINGFGLAVCKLIMERHGGTILAESNGKGATFSVVLPSGSQPEDNPPWAGNSVRAVAGFEVSGKQRIC